MGSHGLVTARDYLYMVESDNVEGFIPDVEYLNDTNYGTQENIAQLGNEQEQDESETISNISSALEMKSINSDNINDNYETTNNNNHNINEKFILRNKMPCRANSTAQANAQRLHDP